MFKNETNVSMTTQETQITTKREGEEKKNHTPKNFQTLIID
jgi:hypothetical protein